MRRQPASRIICHSTQGFPFPRWLYLFLSGLPAAAAVLYLAACAPVPNSSLRAVSYAHPVPPEVTFDMAQGRAITPDRLAARLRQTRLLFLGEHHTEARSHRFQAKVLKLLLRENRPVTLALEMLPPSANGVLDAWRRGQIEEGEFLERSGWYKFWGFPWGYYRRIFLLAQRHRLPMKGVNAEAATRAAARKGDLFALPPALREEIGSLEILPEPQGAYLLDVLRDGGHGGGLAPGSERFQSYRRVQWLWDRLIGGRAARLARDGGDGGIVVVLLGSGHLAHGLGAGLQAARAGTLRQLSIWDDLRDRSARRLYPVVRGMADLVRVYEIDDRQPTYPMLTGLKLSTHDSGPRVESVRAFPGAAASAISVLKPGDLITSLDGKAIRSPARLRLAYEGLTPGATARLTVLRAGKQITLEIPVQAPPAH